MGHLSPVGVQAAQHYWTKHGFFSNIQEVKDNSFCFEKPETSSFYEPQSTTQYLPNSNGNRHVGKWWGVGGSLIQFGNPTAFAIAFPGACRDQTQTVVSFAPLKRSSPQGGGVCSPIKRLQVTWGCATCYTINVFSQAHCSERKIGKKLVTFVGFFFPDVKIWWFWLFVSNMYFENCV